MESLAPALPAARAPISASQHNRRLTEAGRQERLRRQPFIRRRIPNEAEAEDRLQDVFAKLVASYRRFKPVEQTAAWLFRVAREKLRQQMQSRCGVAWGRRLETVAKAPAQQPT